MARDFDGVDDRILHTDSAVHEFTTAESYTWTLWARHDSLTGYQDYFRKDTTGTPRRLYTLRKAATTNIIEYLCGTVGTDLQTVPGTTALSVNTWYFVALVRDVGADQIRIYLATASGDVTQEVSATDTTTTTHGENPDGLSIGSDNVGGFLEVMNGRLAEVTLWNRALSVNELRAVKQGAYYELTGKEGHWPLWGVASPEPDLSRNKNNGTVTGAVAAGHAPVAAPYAPYAAEDYWAAFVIEVGTDHTRTITDPVGITDSRTTALTKVQTDAVGITEAPITYDDPDTTYDDPLVTYDGHGKVIQVLTAIRQPTESVGITDALVQAGVFARTQTDALGITDQVASTLGRFITDTVGLTDSHIRTFSRALTDAIGITDSVIRALGRLLTDALGITDSRPQTVAHIRIQTDPIGITDAVTYQFSGGGTFFVTLTDNIGITDPRVQTGVFARTQTDALGITDARVLALVRELIDPIGITDARVQVAQGFRTLTDPLGITDEALGPSAAVAIALNAAYTPVTVLVAAHTPVAILGASHS